MNATQQSGRLTRDPEVRMTPTGAHVTLFSIAVSRKFKKQEGKNTDFFDCEAWGKTGDTIAEHFRKGKLIEVAGRLEQQEWNDKDGNRRNKVIIVVETFFFPSTDRQSGSRSDYDDSGFGESETSAAAPASKPQGAMPADDIDIFGEENEKTLQSIDELWKDDNVKDGDIIDVNLDDMPF